MKKYNLYLRIVAIFVFILILYYIWPLPFKFVSTKVFVPALTKSSFFISRVLEPVKIISEIKELDDRNKKIEEENLQLKADLARAQEQKNKCLSQIEERELAQKVNVDTIQALVIGKTPFSFNQIYIVNKGYKDGVQEGKAVMFAGYLLGQVLEVSESQASVKLITRHDSLIPIITLESRQFGLAQGGLAGLIITDIPVDADVKEGEAVVTSGLGGNLPNGIPVGKISDIKSKSDSLFKDIRIEYPINLNSVEVVSIAL